MTDRRIVLDGLAFAEGPRWHDGALHLSDMHDHRVLRVGADGRSTTLVQHDGPVSGLGWLPDGRLLVVAMQGQVLRREHDGAVNVHADVTHLAPHEINDMISHPGGWSYVGQFGYPRASGRPPQPSALLRIGRDGTVVPAAEGLVVANGMALTDDGEMLLVAESGATRISAFRVGDDGALGDRRVWAELPTRHAPDGMCLDAEGALWVAAVVAGGFVRVTEGGRITDRIEVEDGRHAIACVLGNDDRRTLFLLTAATLGDADESRRRRSARVEAVEVDVPGVGRP